MYNVLKFKKVAILTDVKSDYSVGLTTFFRDKVKELGATVVAESSYGSGDADFKAQLTAIRSKDPEVIFLPGYYTEVGLIARQAIELGMKTPFLGVDGWDSPKLIEIAQDALEGSYFSNHYSHEVDKAVVQSFIKAYQTVFNIIPDGLAAQGYDAAKVLIAALERSKDFTRQAIRDEIAKTKNHVGVTGTITLDEKGDANKSVVIIRIGKGGEFKYHSTIDP